MKVTLPKEYKSWMTVAQLEAARQIIKDMKDDETTVKEYAEMGARVVFDWYDGEVFKASAEIAGNSRNELDQFGEGAGHLDVYIRFMAFSHHVGFVDAGVYLSDLWSLTGDNKEEIRSHMYVDMYTKQK